MPHKLVSGAFAKLITFAKVYDSMSLPHHKLWYNHEMPNIA